MFGWGSSKKLSPRDIQIDQLKKTFPSLHETARGEDNVFDISSRTHGGTNFTIRVFLRKAFPADKPVILVYTPPGCEFSHPSVDAKTNEICGMEKLNRWHPNTSLVEIVNDALILGSRLDSYRVRGGQPQGAPAYSPQGQAHPHYGYGQTLSPHNAQIQPQARSIAQQQPMDMYTSSYLSSSQSQPSPADEMHLKSSSGPNPPPTEKERQKSEEFHSVMLDVPTHFPELKQLSEAQLERLLKDDVALKSHMATIGAVSSLRDLRESIRSSNLDNALDSMKMEADITKLAEECSALQNSLKQQVTEFLSNRENANARFGIQLSDVKSQLSAKMADCDSRSEEMGDQFVNGTIDLQIFLQTYRDLRVQYHSLQIKNDSI